MSPHLLLPLLVAAIGSTMLLPQLVRTLRTRTAAGVSIAGLTSGVTAYAAWGAYSLHAGDESAAAALVVPGTINLCALAAACLLGGDRRGMRTPALLAAALLAALLVGGWDAYAVVLVTTVVCAYGPAIWSAAKAESVEGISLATWALCGAYGAAFLGLGIVHADAAYLGSGIGNLVLPYTVIQVVVLRRRSEERTRSIAEACTADAADLLPRQRQSSETSAAGTP